MEDLRSPLLFLLPTQVPATMATRAAVVASLLGLLRGAAGSHTFESRLGPEDADLALPGCRRPPGSAEHIFSFKTTSWDPSGLTPLEASREKCQNISVS